jgi:hypothetical protein
LLPRRPSRLVCRYESTFRIIRRPQIHGLISVLFGKSKPEAALSSRRSIVLCLLLGGLLTGWLTWRNRSSPPRPSEKSAAIINKQPVTFASRTFDPTSPPPDMPPLATGEEAECDSNFLSNASVGGQTRKVDATHARVTITQIKMTLQLSVTIWAPAGVSPHVLEHEEGHRQIAEYYYQTAGELAQRIATKYVGRQVEITGADLDAESSKMLQQGATEITDEYNKELNPEPTQLLYDGITDHGRNEVVVKDAVASAIKNVAFETTHRVTSPGN